MTMRRYQITLVNEVEGDKPLYIFTTITKQTFNEAATAAYVYRAARGFDWMIESIVQKKN